MKFIELKDGALISPSIVTKVVQINGMKSTDFDLYGTIADRGFYKIGAAAAKFDPLTTFADTIPANPGWYVVSIIDMAEDPNITFLQRVHREPIVAWRVSGLIAAPVCLEELSPGWPPHILSPDGRVTAPETAWWGSLECWATDQEEKRRS